MIKSFYVIYPEAGLSLKQWFSIFAICDQLGVDNSIREQGMFVVRERRSLSDISEFYRSKPEVLIVQELSNHFHSQLLSTFSIHIRIEAQSFRFSPIPCCSRNNQRRKCHDERFRKFASRVVHGLGERRRRQTSNEGTTERVVFVRSSVETEYCFFLGHSTTTGLVRNVE